MEHVNITYLGHACFCLTYQDYRTVVDPYIDGMIPGLPPLRVEAEAVYCSHQHDDHNYVQAVTIRKTAVPAPYTVEEFTTPHDGEGGRLRGMNTVRIFRFGSLRVAHMGDVGRPLTETETAKLKGVDCLLLPVGGYYTIDACGARAMTERIQPRVLIPMHYRTKTTGFAEIAPLEDFTGLYPHVEYGGNSVELTKETPEQVLVLRREPMRIEPFSPENLDKVAVLAQRLNAKRENGSAFCCSEADSIRRDFEENMATSFGCWEEDTPVGLLSCYPDWEKRNADCAILIDPNRISYEAAAQALLAAVRKTLGTEMACTFFFPKENHDCTVFLEQTGAKRQVSEYSMLLKKDHWRNPPVNPVPQPLRPEQARDFARLHDAVFPGVYCSGQDILETWGKNRFIYVLERQQELVAYGVLQSSGGKRVTAEIVGVREDFRCHGYGRAILNHLAETAFTQFGAEELDLIVDGDNQRAINLYLSVGFTIVQENCCYILK